MEWEVDEGVGQVVAVGVDVAVDAEAEMRKLKVKVKRKHCDYYFSCKSHDDEVQWTPVSLDTCDVRCPLQPFVWPHPFLSLTKTICGCRTTVTLPGLAGLAR